METGSEKTPDEFKTTIWAVEDDDIFRTMITNLIGVEDDLILERTFASCEDCLKELKPQNAPEVLLLDIGLPGMSGTEGLSKIKNISPATDIIMLTMFEDNNKIFQAICGGASGYMLKNSAAQDIVRAVRDVMAGGSPMNPQIARKVLEMFSKASIPQQEYGLTEREKEILGLMVEGLTKRIIADKLFLSYFTIDTHIKNIYTKLQVHTRGSAVAKAFKENLL